MNREVRAAIVVFILCLACVPSAHGQNEPFSRIAVFGGGAYDVGDNRIHDYWEPSYGGELSFMTPFYFGDAELGAAYHPYDVTNGEVPRFDAIHVFAGWGIRLSPISSASWYNGFRLGNNRMTFDEDTFAGVKNESEFLLGAQSKLTIRLFRQTGIFAAAHFTQTYTYVRFRTLHVSAGLTTSFATPSWLQTFLR